MKTPRLHRPAPRRAVAALAALALLLGPIGPTAQAQTKLADIPIASKVDAKPNIVYTVDDSGSMKLDYLPDFMIGNHCRLDTGAAMGTGRGACGAGGLNTFTYPPFYAADFNYLAYNPNVTYTPAVDYSGSVFPVFVSTFPSQNNFAAVRTDPFLSAATVDLTVKVNVPLYCNSDWPLSTSIGVNGQFDPTKGADCRINGTQYAAQANGAPNTPADYNYPWQKTNAAQANNAQYYWRNGQTRSIWCDKTAPGWPTVACAAYCPAGTPIVTSTPQTCNFIGNQTTCTSTVYTPAGCNLWTPGIGQPVGGCIGTVGVECQACNSSCGSSIITGRNGRCSISNAACNCTGAGCTLPACPNVNVITGCTIGSPSTTCPATTASCSTRLSGANPLNTTLLQDSNLVNGGTGSVCRHNNMAYATAPAVAASPFNYVSSPTPDPQFNFQINDGSCGSIPATVQIPRHYYVTSGTQFCNSSIGTLNVQWRGFGTGVCQNKNDLNTFTRVQYQPFTRVDLISGNTFPYTDPYTGVPSTRTYAQEIINYANWFAYYRTRILAAKTTSSQAFSFIDDTYRVGFHTFSTPGTAWLDVKDFAPGLGNQKDLWYQKLFAISIGTAKTPTLDALLRIGNLFEKGGSAGLPVLGSGTLPAAAADPITLSCQSNFHIVFTDGATNQLATPAPAWIGNQDLAVAALSPTQASVPPDQVLNTLRPLAGASPWPLQFRESGAALPNSLSDIATYYWWTDLRPAMKNDVPSFSSVGTGDVAVQIFPPGIARDVAWWQHVNMSAISFGAEGELDGSTPKPVLDAIALGTKVWPRASPPNLPTTPPGNPGAHAIDDLWHATFNARGQYVYARTPLEVSQGLASILSGIQNQRKARVGASFSGQVLSAANDIIYEALIEPGWAGDLIKVHVDPATGVEVSRPWQAKNQVALQIQPAFFGDEPWMDETKRRIVTWYDDGAGGIAKVPFRHASLHANQLATLGTTLIQQEKVVSYLRGGSTYTPTAGPPTVQIEGTSIGQFRVRYGALGDISNAQPVIVEPPTRPYLDANDAGYSGFKALHALRRTQVVAPANDGMVHVFDGGIPALLDDGTGNETWAYIPKALFRPGPTGIHALTYQDGGVPIFKHHFYVDSSPRAADISLDVVAGGPWRSVVVGGLGKGGSSYYAIDVTDATAATEAAAAAKLRWEVTPPDMGYSYGRPVIVKTRAFGGRWVVFVTTGYNNPSGIGKLHVLDAIDGSVLKTMSTGAGTPGNPSGFAQIHAFVKDFRNQIAEQVYGGDLLGNFWRFDVSDPNPALWTVNLFAQLVDPAGNPQPVTTAPQIEIDYNNGIDRYVFIGTGKLLDTSDLVVPPPPQPQTFYAIRDGVLTAPLTAGLPIDTNRATTKLKPANATAPIAGGAPDGWYHDLPAGQRIVVDIQADINVAAYIATEAQPDPCIIVLPATLYAKEFASARSLLDDGSGGVLPSVSFATGGVGLNLVALTDPATGAISLGLLVGSELGGLQNPVPLVNPVVGPTRRLSWRLLTGE